MRIGMQTWGSEGDVRPLVALADALAARGHEVEVVVTPLGRVEHAPAAPRRIVRQVPPGDGADLEAFHQRLGRRPGPLRVLKGLINELLIPVLPAMEEAAADLAGRSDLLLGHFLAHPLHAAALAAGRPFVSLCYSPILVPTASAPPQAFPSLGRLLNPLLWRCEDHLIDRVLLRVCHDGFARAGASPLPRRMREAWLSPRLNLVAVSPTLCPRPADWAAQHVITGELIRPAPPGPLPTELAAFLDAGEPPVYLGLGSPQQAAPIEATTLLAGAARAWGGRAIVRSLDPARPPWTVDGRILFAGPCDHRALFPRCAAVVHHGGAGTSHAVARAGVPSATLTFIDEQTTWGRALARQHVAPPPLRARRATPLRVAELIRSALACQPAARSLAQRMAGEDGLGEACRRIEGLGSP